MEKKQLTLVEWCDQQVAEGHDLTIHWDGGGDSGWVHFQIDGSEVSDDYTSKLVDYAYDELDYGSWAGEFTATGSATYNPETKCFEGIDNYSEDQSIKWNTEIKVLVPRSLWFDTLMIDFENETIDTRFQIKNGYLSNKHSAFIEEFNKFLEEKISDVISDFSEIHSFRSIWDSIHIKRSEFTEEGDMLSFTIESIEIGTYSESEKDIVLDVSAIDDYFNENEENNEEE